MQSFDLDRFKTGEPVYDNKTDREYFYIGTLSNGVVAIRTRYLEAGWVKILRTPFELHEETYVKNKPKN